MKKKIHRYLGVLIALAILVAAISLGAFAQGGAGTGTGKAIRFAENGAVPNIVGGQGSNVYFGQYAQGRTTYGVPLRYPVKWRVLEKADGKLFLLSDKNLDVMAFHTDDESVTWEKSTLRSWLNGYAASENLGGDDGTDYTTDNFIANAFSDKERAILATTKEVTLLTAEEAAKASYGFADDDSRKSLNTQYVQYGGKLGSEGLAEADEPDAWWLRSPVADDKKAAFVDENGAVSADGVAVDDVTTTVRPALYLDTSSVLFTSESENAKVGRTGELKSIDNYTGADWKLTLLDESRNTFAIQEKTATVAPGGTVEVTYSGATVYKKGAAPNEYISAILVDDNGEPLYYGRITQPINANGTMAVKIPVRLAEGAYTLKLFSEQYNSYNMTDYAGDFVDLPLTVKADSPVIKHKKLQLGATILKENANTAAAQLISYRGLDWFVIAYEGKNGDGYDICYTPDALDPPEERKLYENAAGTAALLLKDGVFEGKYNAMGGKSDYVGSLFQKNIDGILSGFSDEEKAAVAPRDLVGGGYPHGDVENYDSNGMSGDDVPGALLWPLSAAEANALSQAVKEEYFLWDWWLRTPGLTTNNAAFVSGGYGHVNLTGETVYYGSWNTVRPAFHLDLDAVLLTSAAGGKSGTVGALNAVGDYTGSEWKLTLKDEKRQFNAGVVAVDGDKLTVAWSGAKTGDNEFLSALIKDDNSGDVAYYGRLKALSDDSDTGGTYELDLSTVDMTGKTLCVFNEQCNGGENDAVRRTDYASALVALPMTVNAYDVDLDLTGITAADVPFVIFNEDYATTLTVVDPENDILPADVEVKIGDTPLSAGDNTYTWKADTGELTIAAAAITGAVTITAAAVAKTYVISVDPTDINFGDDKFGYAAAPDAETVTVANEGNQSVTLTAPTATVYEVGTLSATTLAPGETATFTLRPVTGLNAKDDPYAETIIVQGANGDKVTNEATLNASFTVHRASLTLDLSLDDWTYGETAKTPVLSGNVGDGEVKYEYKPEAAGEDAYKEDIPENAGKYTLCATVAATANYEGTTATTSFEIKKAAITLEVTVADWIYGETASTPVVTGNPGEGAVKYEYKAAAAGEDAYKEEVPANAGQYTLRATVAATANYEGDAATTSFEIKKAPITPAVTIESWIYGETASTPVVTGNPGEGAVKVEYKPESAPESEYKEAVPTAVGKYALRATVAESDNYLGNTATTTFEIFPAMTVPVTENGSVTLEPADAKPGDEVTVTPQPAEGYDPTIRVVADGGEEIPVTKNDDGTITFTMPTTNATVTPTFAPCPSSRFTDVDQKAWYHEYVDYVIAKGLMKGVTATTFEPETATSRAMLVMILYRLAGEQEISGKSPFKDVKDNSWYGKAVIWAYENKIVDGYGGGYFGPDDAVTREQLATIFYRYSGKMGYDVTARGDLSQFSDADQISGYAKAAMSWAVGVNLIEGMGDNTVAPQADSTRAQIAAILTRFCENLMK